MDNLTSENATHLLSCAHAIALSRMEYKMRCHILKDMDDGRVKVLVFGERNWKGKEHISRIRYVSKRPHNQAPHRTGRIGDFQN